MNRDVLVGSVGEGQTLNRFAFVTGRPVSWVDPFGLEKRPLNFQKKEIVIQAINTIEEYGFIIEAKDLMRLLEQDNIMVDTELMDSNALGQANKFFECFSLAPELFELDFDMYIVPIIAHEYAHILDWRHINYISYG